VFGALLAWWQLDLLTRYLSYVIAFTAASFIYIAVADLIPSLHRGVKLRESLAQITLIVAGIALIGLFHEH
jgi:zinc and cadmium transporter